MHEEIITNRLHQARSKAEREQLEVIYETISITYTEEHTYIGIPTWKLFLTTILFSDIVSCLTGESTSNLESDSSA